MLRVFQQPVRGAPMRKSFVAAAMALALALAAGAQVKGPIVDRILLEARTQEDIALKDVAAGRTDLFDYGVDGATFKSLPDDLRAKLDPYAVTGALYEDVFMNPYPNAAPYTATRRRQGGVQSLRHPRRPLRDELPY